MTSPGVDHSRDETALIARILAGERELFHELIRPYERAVFRTVTALLRNDADAEDVARETMLKAYRSLSHFRAEARFSTWLLTIAINESRMRLRRARTVGFDSLEGMVDEDSRDYSPMLLADWREVPSKVLEEAEIRQLIQVAVARLPLPYREVLVMRDLEERSADETAEALGLTKDVVKVRLHRARMKLQVMLAPQLRASTSKFTEGKGWRSRMTRWR